jgi:hypothetical protein
MWEKITSFFSRLFERPTYQTALERYITSNNPKDICDVERLASQFDKQLSQGRLSL